MAGSLQSDLAARLRALNARLTAGPSGTKTEELMADYTADAPRDLTLPTLKAEDPLDLVIANFLKQDYKLTVNDKYAQLPDITEDFRAVKEDFLDGEYLNQPGITLERMTTTDLVLIGRNVIPMLASGFSKQGAASIFLLAYHLVAPGRSKVEFVFPEENAIRNAYDVSIESLSAEQLVSCLRHEPLPPTKDINKEASAYAFIAASVLRIFTKSEENYIRAFNHIIAGYEKFYGYPCPVHPPAPTIESIKILSAQYQMNPKFKATLYKILYISAGVTGYKGMRSFLFELHLANTGMHILGIFLKLCEVLNCSSGLLLRAISNPEYDRQMNALAIMITVVMNNDPQHQRRMWRYGRLFDEAFMPPLQTKRCPMLVYILASALKSEAPQTNRDILNIVQLKEVSPEKRRIGDAVAKELIRMVRKENNMPEGQTQSSA